METFTHSEIQNFSTSKLKSIIKNGLADIETEDMILKELFEIIRIKDFYSFINPRLMPFYL